MPLIYLSLGSNVGDRKKYLTKAITELKEIITITKKSSIIETFPLHYKKQRKFLNMAIEAKTNIQPEQLLKKIKAIENNLGRKKRFRYGPREIDIDILSYGNKIIKTRKLIIPHPRLHERKFVLKPLIQINPLLKHLILKKTVLEIYKNL